MLSPSRFCLLIFTSFFIGCSGSSGGGSSSATAVNNVAPGATPGSSANSTNPGSASAANAQQGPVTQKAVQFDQKAELLHTPNGLIFDADVDVNGQFSRAAGGDSTIWTGVYVASQVYRFRSTNDPVALSNMERSLWAIHNCHEITKFPAFFCRSYGDPAWFSAGRHQSNGTGKFQGQVWSDKTTSRDQYTGIFYAYAMAWPHIQDQKLKDAIKSDCLAVARHLMTNKLALKAPVKGVVEEHFRVDPSNAYLDRNITAQEWAKIDDFPFNLIVKQVPYDPMLITALRTVKIPPVRGGEALRGLMFFSVCAHITRDPAIEAYYRSELLGKRKFDDVVVNYSNFLDDLLAGKNGALVKKALAELLGSFDQAIVAYVGARWGNPYIAGLFAPLLQNILHSIGGFIGQQIANVTKWLSNPNNLNNVNNVGANLQMLAQILDMFGQKKLAANLRNVVVPVNNYSSAPLSEAADAMRSYVGYNLKFLSYAALLEVESDAQLKSKMQGSMNKSWEYINDEYNALFNTIHSGYGQTIVPADVADSLRALTDHPGDLRQALVDNSNMPGLIVTPWPDRFGRTGNIAIDPFSLDRRPIHNYVWQQHPATIKDGSNNPTHIESPEGYLLAYWMGRYFGFWSDKD